MAKGKKVCYECGAEFHLRDKKCPECGARYYTKFKLGPGDVLIHKGKGEEISIGTELHGGYRVRICGQSTTYHSNYQSILRHIKHARLNLKSGELKSVDELIKIEQETLKFIKGINNKLKKEIE